MLVFLSGLVVGVVVGVPIGMAVFPVAVAWGRPTPGRGAAARRRQRSALKSAHK